jgi:tripartite-type tricarboxylate transporter receptor subunit TctC
MKRMTSALAISLLVAAAPAPAWAQAGYPSKPIRLIVPTPAGGPSDAAARLVGEALAKSMGQAVLIDNRPGASGAIAAQALMAAPADGHTLMWTLSSMSGLPVLQKSSPYQSLNELTPVTLIGHFQYALFVNPELPAKTVPEFIDHARARPDQLSFATGSLADYMVTTRFMKATGTRAVRVPYRGAAQLLPDLVSARVQFNFGPLSSALPQARDHKLRLLAIVGPRRSPLAPEVPTLAEAGLGAITVPSWQGVFGPPKMAQDVAERLSRDMAAALATPELRSQLERLALVVEGSTPAALATAAARDAQLWRDFVLEYEIPPE